MVVAQEVINVLDRFREDVDAIFKIREVRSDDNREALAVETSVSVASASSLTFHARILQFDLDNRHKLWNGEIGANEFEELDGALVYFSKVWLWYTEQFLDLSDMRSIEDERLEQLRGMVIEMEANLRARSETERLMGPNAVTMEASALEESRSGQTRPIF